MKHILLALVLVSSFVRAAQYPAPTDVHETRVIDKEVSLSWNKANGANGYAVYLMGTSSNTQLAVIDDPDQTSYIVTSLDPYTYYNFAVTAGYYVNGRVEESDFSEQVNVRTTHTWSGTLKNCLPFSLEENDPVTLSQLLNVQIFSCYPGEHWPEVVGDMASVVDLKNIVELDLHDNTNANISNWNVWFSELTSLKKLNLNYVGSSIGGIGGGISNTVGQLTQLEELKLASTGLTGSIPETIGNLINLKILDLYYNHLVNIIPNTIGNMTNLELLRLSNNHFSGSIPISITDLINLKTLNLSYDHLSGQIPPEIGLMKNNLIVLSLNHNGFSGTIPEEIGNLENLTSLNLSENYLEGTIPKSLTMLSKLTSLPLNNNRLTGTIPIEFGTMKTLRSLNLSSNKLEGKIPQQISEMTWLGFLYLSHNHLEGMLPENIFNLEHLLTLEVDDNNLYGSISSNILQRNSISLRLFDNCNLYSNDNLVQNFIDNHAEEHDGVLGYQYILNTNHHQCFYPAMLTPVIKYILD